MEGSMNGISGPRVATVMTPFPYHVDADADLSHARDLMREHHIRHLPVMRDGKLAGVVTERDVDLAVAVAGTNHDPNTMRVWSVCQREPFVVELDTSLAEVVQVLADRQIGSALVVRHGRLAGIITMVDICRTLAGMLRPELPPDEPA
jgi:acetoin utilization protein AcuB